MVVGFGVIAVSCYHSTPCFISDSNCHMLSVVIRVVIRELTKCMPLSPLSRGLSLPFVLKQVGGCDLWSRLAVDPQCRAAGHKPCAPVQWWLQPVVGVHHHPEALVVLVHRQRAASTFRRFRCRIWTLARAPEVKKQADAVTRREFLLPNPWMPVAIFEPNMILRSLNCANEGVAVLAIVPTVGTKTSQWCTGGLSGSAVWGE